MRNIIIGGALLISLFVLGWQFANTSQNKVDNTPKLRPGEWLDIRMLRGSEISPTHRARVNAQLQTRAARRGGLANWQFIGPSNIGGRIVDMAVDPTQANTLYAAAASGGVWQSTDTGTTFSSVWPNGNAQSMGAIAISSTGQLYAGTGESNPGGGSLTYGNAGIFRRDGNGQTWTQLGLVNSERISRIAIDPSNESRLFVAATGPLYNPGGERGVYRSVDSGATWQLVLAGDNDTTGASDVHVDPANPNLVYAAMWDHLRQPALRRYGGTGSGLYRSSDGGDSWERMGTAHGLPAVDADIGRVSIALAPSDPQTLYANYLNTRGFFTGFYKSADGGNSWTAQPFSNGLANSQSSFGWWFARIWVDPADKDHVFVAGVPLMESDNGGASFITQNTVHADQHAMSWDANVPGRVYLGNDGGVYRSDSNGSANWIFATEQPFTQFYTLDVSEQDPTRVVGGTQDNRCLRSYDFTGAPQWNTYGSCGDGLETLINPVDQQIVYSCSQYGFCGVSTNGGNNSSSIGATASNRNNWLTPLVFDPTDPQIIYYAGNLVERSTNGGASFQTISPDLTDGDPFPNPIDPYPFGTVTTLAASALDGTDLLIGTDGGRVWRTLDLGLNWTEIDDPVLPDRWVTKVLWDPAFNGTAYISYSGFRNGDNTAYVFKTVSTGQTWTDITSDLPSAPVNAMTLTPGGELLVANDVGVYKREAGGAWSELGAGLPLVPVTDLRVIGASQQLFASTFGRGIWKLDVVLDADSDGITDTLDNCTQQANPDQTDTDGDGYGNACDADFNQDCLVTFADVASFPPNFLGSAPLYDMNNDGSVNFGDYALLVKRFLQAPGPGGTAGICVP